MKQLKLSSVSSFKALFMGNQSMSKGCSSHILDPNRFLYLYESRCCQSLIYFAIQSGLCYDNWKLSSRVAHQAVVATSTWHSDRFGRFPEHISLHFQNILSTQTREVRSDIMYYETNGGGTVFRVGASVGFAHSDGVVSRITSHASQEMFSKNLCAGISHWFQ